MWQNVTSFAENVNGWHLVYCPFLLQTHRSFERKIRMTLYQNV